MTDAEIKIAIRRGIKEQKPEKVSGSMLTDAIAEAVNQLGMMLKKYASESLKTRKSITSTMHVFDYPSDCDVLLDVWDLDTNAGTITNATNATPIVITEASHERSTDDIVTIHDVLGNTAANATWKITKVDDNSYSLNGSVGNAAYISGGKVFEETTDFLKMTIIPESESTLDDDSEYYLRNNQIIIDDVDFTNDLLITYIHSLSSTADIPTKYHWAIVAFGVIYLIEIPDAEAKDFTAKTKSLELHTNIWQSTTEDIKHGSQITVKSARGISKMKWL
jgi:hypothetical protein